MTSLLDIFDNEPTPKTAAPTTAPIAAPAPVARPQPSSGSFYGHDLKEDVHKAARTAAEAVDVESAARAALDAQRETIRAKLNLELAGLEKALKDATTIRLEAEAMLMKVMGVEKITRIPMEDRPDIQIKTTPGRKLNITKTWLDDPEGIVAKTYGPAAPGIIWNAVPKSDPKTEVIVPARYDDEPSS